MHPVKPLPNPVTNRRTTRAGRYSCMALSALAAVAVASPAMSYQAGDLFVRAGAVQVAPDESSGGIAIPALDVAAIAGTDARVDNDTQLGLTLTYMYSHNFGVELLAATPFEHDITANLDGHTAGLQVPAGSTKHLPPTVSAVYYPLADNSSAVQPYVGAGINYTRFFSEDVAPELEALTGVLAAGEGADPIAMKLELDDSWGLALQLGVDVALDPQWHLNGSVRWIDIDTKASFSNAGDVITVGNIELDPWVYQINVGYTF